MRLEEVDSVSMVILVLDDLADDGRLGFIDYFYNR
jgi:hypothetical protein